MVKLFRVNFLITILLSLIALSQSPNAIAKTVDGTSSNNEGIDPSKDENLQKSVVSNLVSEEGNVISALQCTSADGSCYKDAFNDLGFGDPPMRPGGSNQNQGEGGVERVK